MSIFFLRAPIILAVAFCAGCVASPPPTPLPPPPDAALPAPAQTASAPAAPAGQTCREFQQTITLDGAPQEAWGTTCLQPDGTWKVMTSQQPGGAAPAPQPVTVPSYYPAYAYNPYPYPYPYYYYPPYYYGRYGGAIVVRGR